MTTRTTFRPASNLSYKTAIPIALLVLIASILCARAGQDVVVKVPFEFQAGDAHFAPGTYTLSMDRLLTGSVVIQSADCSRRAVLLTGKSITAPVTSAPVVSFRTYGESRFLSAIQGDGAAERWVIVPSPSEASLARTSSAPSVATFVAESTVADGGTK